MVAVSRTPRSRSAPDLSLVSHSVVVKAIDWTFAVEHRGSQVGREVSRVLRPLAATGSPTSTYVLTEHGPDPVHQLTLDGQAVGRTNHAHAIVNRLVWSINRELAARVQSHVLLHGGCVAIGNRAVVVTGPSGAGKSTLVTALVRAGYSYFTDEAVAFDKATGQISPFTRAITLKRGSWSLFPELRPPPGDVLPPFTSEQWHVDPESAGPVAMQSDTAAPALLLRLERTDHDPGELVPVSRGEMLTTLLDQGLNSTTDPSRAFRTLAQTARNTPTYALRYRTPAEAVALVQERLSADLP